MNFLEERILRDGQVREGDILKVDSFLNHQLDTGLLDKIGETFYHHFQGKPVTRVLTVEASGIAVAYPVARMFKVPVVFAKKSRSMNLDGDLYTSVVHSYTYNIDNTLTLSKHYLGKDDSVLIVDDFMANGKAVQGLLDICRQAGAQVAGIGIAIEKGFQNEPRRCKACRDARKAQNGNGGAPRQMFTVICDGCGCETQVPFQPRGDRPVYCRDCFEAQRQNRF